MLAMLEVGKLSPDSALVVAAEDLGWGHVDLGWGDVDVRNVAGDLARSDRSHAVC